MELDNAKAFYALAGYYVNGDMGLTQDNQKANEVLLMGGERGCAAAYYNLGTSYYHGRGAEVEGYEKSKILFGTCSYDGECV